MMRGRGLWKLAASAGCVLAALFAAAALSPKRTVGPCTRTGDPAMLRDVPEASGLAVSRRSEGLIWTHNDSGNDPVLFAIDATGTVQGRVRLPISTRDWEDISAAPCPAGNCLYISDIGDNELVRKSVRLFRVPEPDPQARQSGRPDVFTVTYPDGPHNAEASFIADGRLFIVTRDRTGGLYRSTSLLGDGGDVMLERIAELGLAAVTDAEASPDQAAVVVRTADELVMYRTADLIRGGRVARGLRIPIGGLREPQGEAIALADDGTIYLASEGRPWNPAGRLVSLRCSAS
jgi:hypothetical protein